MRFLEELNVKNVIGTLLSIFCFLNVRFSFIGFLSNWNFYVELFGWLAIIFAFSEYLVPIEKRDLRKFIPFAVKFFAIIFIYTIARQVKDALIVSSFGGEGATICKIFVLIFGLFYPLLYQKISRAYPINYSVYISMVPFVGYYLLHAFVLYGNSYITPNFTSSSRFLQLLNNWPDLLYYVLAEMFATIGLSVYFWQTANHFHNKEECKRVYPVFMIIAQFATLLTSGLSSFLCTNKSVLNYLNGYGGVIQVIALIMLTLSVVIFIANDIFFENLTDEEKAELENQQPVKGKVKKNINIFETIKNNPTSILISLLTVCYGICTLWIEQFWKTRAKDLYPLKSDYQAFSSYYFLIQSRLSLIMTIFGSSILLNYVPWLINALITPIIVYFAGISLFGVDLLRNILPFNPSNLTANIVLIGIFIVGLFKSAKYSSFDTTKEFFLISTKSKEERSEIKDVEGYFSRQGKSVTALIMGLVFSISSSLSYKSTPIVWFLWIGSAIMATVWCGIVISLNTQFEDANNQVNSKSDNQVNGTQTQSNNQVNSKHTQSDNQVNGTQTQSNNQVNSTQTQSNNQDNSTQTQSNNQDNSTQTQSNNQDNSTQTQSNNQDNSTQTQSDNQDHNMKLTRKIKNSNKNTEEKTNNKDNTNNSKKNNKKSSKKNNNKSDDDDKKK